MATGDTAALGAGLKVRTPCSLLSAHSRIPSTCVLRGSQGSAPPVGAWPRRGSARRGLTSRLATVAQVLSTARETLARAAAASVSGEGEADELITTHRTRRLLRALLAERGVSEAVRGEARQLQHATRHGKHGQHGKRAAATEDKVRITLI